MLKAKGFRWLGNGFVADPISSFSHAFYTKSCSQPEIMPILSNLLPKKEIIFNPSMLYIAIGILGATVMPHNLYFHTVV